MKIIGVIHSVSEKMGPLALWGLSFPQTPGFVSSCCMYIYIVERSVMKFVVSIVKIKELFSQFYCKY